MRSWSKKIEHEYALLGQGVDHQMGLIQQEGRIAGPIGALPRHGNAEGAESGGAGGGNKKPADHLDVPEMLGGYAGELGRKSRELGHGGESAIRRAGQNIDIARNDLRESFVLRRRTDSSRTHAHSTL